MSQHARQEVNWEFLLNSSKSTLQAYESSRLNFATNLRKEIEQLLQVWVDESSNALLARWLIERNLTADASAMLHERWTRFERSQPDLQAHEGHVACGPGSAAETTSRVTRQRSQFDAQCVR